jgi:hypothetical protein
LASARNAIARAIAPTPRFAEFASASTLGRRGSAGFVVGVVRIKKLKNVTSKGVSNSKKRGGGLKIKRKKSRRGWPEVVLCAPSVRSLGSTLTTYSGVMLAVELAIRCVRLVGKWPLT